jgi:hypothetical protein
MVLLLVFLFFPRRRKKSCLLRNYSPQRLNGTQYLSESREHRKILNHKDTKTPRKADLMAGEASHSPFVSLCLGGEK